jgi:hypothetical protein
MSRGQRVEYAEEAEVIGSDLLISLHHSLGVADAWRTLAGKT